MDVEIIEEVENPMLHRTDVRFELVHDEATPSRLSVRDSLAAKLNKDADEVLIHKLDTKYGMRQTVGYAKVYESPEFAREVEQDYTLSRNKIAVDGEGLVEEGGDGDDGDDGEEGAEDTEVDADADTEADADAEEGSGPDAEADVEAEEA